MSKVEEVWFKGPDKNLLQGWIMKPPSFNPRKKYPSILYIHGGPLTQYGKLFFHEFEVLAANGYVVYFCNPRGGKGYGEEHAAAIWGAWGTADYDDLIAWTDYMEKQPYIDRERMGDRRLVWRLYDVVDHRSYETFPGGDHGSVRE